MIWHSFFPSSFDFVYVREHVFLSLVILSNYRIFSSANSSQSFDKIFNETSIESSIVYICETVPVLIGYSKMIGVAHKLDKRFDYYKV